MAAISACPDRHDLERLLLGAMPDNEAAGLEEHVAHCGHCLDTVRGLKTEDDLVAALRSGAKQTAPLPDQAADWLLGRLYHLPRCAAGDRTHEIYDLLAAAQAA